MKWIEPISSSNKGGIDSSKNFFGDAKNDELAFESR
jgi:hypothetical protein